MCLTLITPPPPTNPTYGYKIFSELPGRENLLGLIYTAAKEGYVENVWYEDGPHHLRLFTTLPPRKAYKSGFHVFLNEEDAWARVNSFSHNIYLVVKKVEVGNIQTWGIEMGSTAFTCWRMKICA